MKTRIAALVTGLALTLVAQAAATFTVSPSVVSNDYNGIVTFQMSGLTNTEAVIVEQFFDFNSNNVVDAGDLRVRLFRATDGKPKVFGGVTNRNVLRDQDGATNGAITVSYQFPFSPELARGCGRYTFRFSSPSAAGGSVNVPFTVTNRPYNQTISGSVKNGATNIPNALVAILEPNGEGQRYILGGAANAAGNYSLKVPVGNYAVIAVKSNFVADFATLPQVAATSNSTQSGVNVTLIATTRSLSGSLVDSTNTSLLIDQGAQLFVQSTNNLFTIAFADTNGSFTVPITSDFWRIEVGDSSVASYGDLFSDNKPYFNATGGNVSGANVPLLRGTAVIYGTVKDNFGAPIPALDMFVSDSTNGFGSAGYTDSNGVYFLAAAAGSWYPNVDNFSPAAANYIFTSTNVNVSDGQAVQVNFVGTPVTARLRGQLTDNFGAPIGLFRLNVGNNSGGFTQGDTDSNGDFDIPIYGGTWSVNPGGNDNGDAQSRGLVFPSLTVNIIDGVNKTNNIIAQRATGQISGYVRDTNSAGIPNLNVYASATIGSTNYSVGTRTDGGGNYSFAVFNATWSVGVDGDALNNLGYNQVNNAIVPVPPTNAPANFVVTPITPLSITSTNPLTQGTVGNFYSQSLDATGGVPGYTWNFTSGSPPGGVTLDPFGYLSGTPTNPGTFCFVAQVTDQRGSNATSNLCVTINPACPVAVVTTALPDGAVGCSYSNALQATCGAPPYRWSLAFGSAPLPANLVLGTNGTVSGTPTTNGLFNFVAVVTDSLGASNSGTVQLSINPAVQVTTTSLPDGTAGVAYSASLSATGGAQPQTWSVVSGSLPPNLTLNTNTGQISGTTTNTGTFNFTARVSDPCTFADRALSITIYSPLSVATVSLPKAHSGVFYSAALLPAGGQPPYLWQLALGSGPLPSGIGLSSTGLISGPSGSAATNDFIVQVNDGGGRQATRGLSIITLARPVLDQASPLASNQFRFRVTGATGESYTVQFASSLSNFADLFTTSAASSVFFFTDTNAPNSNRIYRLRVNP